MAGQHLIEINQPESGVKETYEPLPAGRKNNQPKSAEDNMEDIVSRRSTSEPAAGWDEKPRDTNQNQDWGEDCQGYIVGALLINVEPPLRHIVRRVDTIRQAVRPDDKLAARFPPNARRRQSACDTPRYP